MSDANPGVAFKANVANENDKFAVTFANLLLHTQMDGSQGQGGTSARTGGGTGDQQGGVDCKYYSRVELPSIEELWNRLQVWPTGESEWDIRVNPGKKLGLGISRGKFTACIIVEFLIRCTQICRCTGKDGRVWTITMSVVKRTLPNAFCKDFWLGAGYTWTPLAIYNTAMTVAEMADLINSLGLMEKMLPALNDLAGAVADSICQGAFGALRNPDGSKFNVCSNLPA